MTLNGGTIKDGSSVDANLTLNNVASTANVLVDAIAPVVIAVTVPADGIYVAGQNLDFTVTFSKTVNVTGVPRIPITLDVGGTVSASYIAGSGTGTLTFRHTVAVGEQDPTGIVTATSIDPSVGIIEDSVGNNADLAIGAFEPSTAGITIEALAPVPALDRPALIVLGLLVGMLGWCVVR